MSPPPEDDKYVGFGHEEESAPSSSITPSGAEYPKEPAPLPPNAVIVTGDEPPPETRTQRLKRRVKGNAKKLGRVAGHVAKKGVDKAREELGKKPEGPRDERAHRMRERSANVRNYSASVSIMNRRRDTYHNTPKREGGNLLKGGRSDRSMNLLKGSQARGGSGNLLKRGGKRGYSRSGFGKLGSSFHSSGGPRPLGKRQGSGVPSPLKGSSKGKGQGFGAMRRAFSDSGKKGKLGNLLKPKKGSKKSAKAGFGISLGGKKSAKTGKLSSIGRAFR